MKSKGRRRNDSSPWSVEGGGEEGEVGKNGCDEKVETDDSRNGCRFH
jgi:hypothetical protein